MFKRALLCLFSVKLSTRCAMCGTSQPGICGAGRRQSWRLRLEMHARGSLIAHLHGGVRGVVDRLRQHRVLAGLHIRHGVQEGALPLLPLPWGWSPATWAAAGRLTPTWGWHWPPCKARHMRTQLAAADKICVQAADGREATKLCSTLWPFAIATSGQQHAAAGCLDRKK